MKAGGVDASSEENLEWGSYAAIDQIASYYAKGMQFSDELRPYYEDADGNAVQFSIPFIVTPEDLGDECEPGRGPYPTPTDPSWAPFVDFFESRWAGRVQQHRLTPVDRTRNGRPLRVIRPA